MTNPKRKVNRKTIQNGGYRSKKANKSKRKVNRKTLNRRKYRKTQSGGDVVIDGETIKAENWRGKLRRQIARSMRTSGNYGSIKNMRQKGNARNCYQRVANLQKYLYKTNRSTSDITNTGVESLPDPDLLDQASLSDIDIDDGEYDQMRATLLETATRLVTSTFTEVFNNANNSYREQIKSLSDDIPHLKKLIDHVIENDEDDTILCTGVSTVTKRYPGRPPPKNLPMISGYQEWGGQTYAPKDWIDAYKAELVEINDLILRYKSHIEELSNKFKILSAHYVDKMLVECVKKVNTSTNLKRLLLAYNITIEQITDKCKAEIELECGKIQDQIDNLGVRMENAQYNKIDGLIVMYSAASDKLTAEGNIMRLISLGNNTLSGESSDDAKDLEEEYYGIMFDDPTDTPSSVVTSAEDTSQSVTPPASSPRNPLAWLEQQPTIQATSARTGIY